MGSEHDYFFEGALREAGKCRGRGRVLVLDGGMRTKWTKEKSEKNPIGFEA